jgi:hypothetical protein
MCEIEINWKAYALALCSLLDEIELAPDNEVRRDLLSWRFFIAREHGLTVKFGRPAQRGTA